MVIFLTFLLLLSLAIAAPEWAKSLKRQKEQETIHRGQQYERAIQLYYRKFHQYPSSIKQLLHTNNIRFLRQKYTDPLTGKNDWKLVLYGHAHVHPLGLWGKPLSDLGSLQTTGGGMYAVSGSSGPGSSSSSTSGSDNMGFGSGMSSGFGPSTMNSTSAAPFGSSPTGNTGTGLNSTSKSGSTESANSGFQTNTPFVGVVPPIKGHSIIDYRRQSNYDRWEFNYDPIIDQIRAKVSLLGGGQGDINSNSDSGGFGNNSGSPFSSGPGSSSPGSNHSSSTTPNSSSTSNSNSSDANPF
jgi:type II secretory pathway pseudopilin PulG